MARTEAPRDASSRGAVASSQAEPLDAALVPGCPTLEDGRLSRCQLERVIGAALLWRAGRVRHLVVSGAAVHSAYEEASSMALGLAALGVPPELIYLDRRALHTDENAFNALLIARALGWRSLGVVSQAGHAQVACVMLERWGQPCIPTPPDRAAVIAEHQRTAVALDALRARRVEGWVPLVERERAEAARRGVRPRPASFLHYMWLLWLGANGQVWAPAVPDTLELERWADALGGVPPRVVHPLDPLAGRTRASPDERLID